VALGDRIPGSGTSAIPVYRCATCKDSGRVLAWPTVPYQGAGPDAGDMDMETFKPCLVCDGRSRLAGEIDEPATPTLDLLRDVRLGGPA
jgi:hypothetical protein